LDEHVSALQLVGAALVLAGVAMISLSKPTVQKPATPETR
jgi:drug/metabolite transporter (DMT)-like permease